MNISEAVSKMNTQMLKKKLEMISSMLTPQQQQQMEKAVRELETGDLKKQIENISAGDLKAGLEKNPQLIKALAGNEELVKRITEIMKKTN